MEETGAIDAAKDAILGLAEALRKLPPEAVQFGTTALLVAGGLAAVGVALAGIKTVLQLTGMLALAKGAGGMAARALGMGGAAAAAGAAGGGAAVGAAGGAVARRALLGRAASMFIPGVGWVLGAASLGAGGYAAYEEYQRSGSLGSAAKAGAWGALTLGMGSNSAQASEAPRSSGSGQSDMAQSLGIGNIEGFAQREAQSRQASEAMAQALSESANGIRAGGFDMVAGMNDAAGGIRGGGRDVASALLEAASAIRSAAQQLAAGAAGAARVPLNTGRGMGAASTY